MMEHQHDHYFSPQAHDLMSSTLPQGYTHCHIDGNFDPMVVPGYDESCWDVDDLTLLGGELLFDDDGEIGGYPQFSLCLEDDERPPTLGQGAGVEGTTVREQNRDDGDSCMEMTRKRRRDRSKTLVSERKRRVRMKEKLYELRSLVPNITKMDKTSIIADAVVYVKNLQSQAKTLDEEISMLESCSSKHDHHQVFHDQNMIMQYTDNACTQFEVDDQATNAHHGTKITHVGAVQVGDRRFFVTVEGEKRDRVAASLYSAVESLLCFHFECSNFGFSSDRFLSTLTLKVREFGDESINACTVKLWVMAALLKEGFQPELMATIS